MTANGGDRDRNDLEIETMTREQALQQLNVNPNATFNGRISAEIINALSKIEFDLTALQIWLEQRDGDIVTGERIREIAKRSASRLPVGV